MSDPVERRQGECLPLQELRNVVDRKRVASEFAHPVRRGTTGSKECQIDDCPAHFRNGKIPKTVWGRLMVLNKPAILQALHETGVMAVIRVETAVDLLGVADALYEGGIRLIEITMTVPSALDAIALTTEHLGDDVFVGAGTVLDATTARMAILAGARFIVGPCYDRDTVQMAHLYDTPVMPGCLTPTEIVQAWKAGADVVKVFPGRVATPGYFQDLRGPFPQIRLMPTGNVDLRTAAEYIQAGAFAVAVGKALVNPQALRLGDLSAITKNARQFREAVDAARAIAS